MKYLVAVVFGAGILVAISNAACFRSDNKIIFGQEPKGCYFGNKMHLLNSEWRTKDCWDCTCNSVGNYRCCTAYGRPVNYDQKRCKFVFDQKECKYKLIPNEDPTIQCESYGMVG
ncbi:beta-microseminoprotein-like [Bufo bufo]|uniref:beta-microseminoprotein-like n=1 Tax=Bufo bufo TaxID=8384 RepID=UPI001ABDE35C|nr:beta-microseminoprotein-like [Bufo bufo]